jgi:hypothetical protein
MNNTFNTDFSKATMTAHAESKNQFLKENNIVMETNERKALPDGTPVVLGIAINHKHLQKQVENGVKTQDQAYLSGAGTWQVPFTMTVLSHGNAQLMNSYHPIQSDLADKPTLEMFNTIDDATQATHYPKIQDAIRSGTSGSPANNYAAKYKKILMHLKMSETFIGDVLSSANNVMNDGSNNAVFNLGDDGFMAMTGLEFAAILKLEKSTNPDYPDDKNSVKKIILPNDPQYQTIMASRQPNLKTFIPKDEAADFNASDLGKLDQAMTSPTAPAEGEWAQPSWQRESYT